ncbi:hypothetical protein [Cellulomonas massiliensis]|uniref:hypothetical protein n=1 Tax=Cellulomonas massiliensis TaxID=1465811 RepID=UPI0002E4D42B|nr:hypothetical protein [Cellulomonas massiliensis]
MNARLDAFRPVPPARPATVRRPDVGDAAWHGLHRDGVLVPLWGDLARVVDAAETPGLRAAALAAVMPARSVLARAAAAWVHTGTGRPARAEVYVRPGARHGGPHPRRVVHESTVAPEHVVLVGGVPVTSLARTAADVARWLPDAAARSLLPALRDGGLDPDEAVRVLDGQRGRHLVVARTRLAALRDADAGTVRPGSAAPAPPSTR